MAEIAELDDKTEGIACKGLFLYMSRTTLIQWAM